MAKRKSLKLGKRKSRTTTSGKVYLNGNSYACLSGLYFTSLNNETAIEEWSKIPFINRPLYGMEFKGFSTNPNDDGSGEDFISIGDLKYPKVGEIYFPIYERKIFSLNSSELDIYKVPLKDLFTSFDDFSLQYLSCETLKFKVSLKDEIILNNNKPSLEIPLKDGSSLTLFKVINDSSNNDILHEICLSNGSFYISALLNGSDCLSDWIDIDDSQSSFGNLEIESFEIVPRINLTNDALEYKNFIGRVYNLVDGTLMNNAFDGNSPTMSSEILEEFSKLILRGNVGTSEEGTVDNNATISYVNPHETMFPFKSPSLYFPMSMTLENYYKHLNIDLDLHQYVSVSKSANTLLKDLSKNYSLEMPSHPIISYETTLCPKKSGWYQFLVASDDVSLLAIDDVVLGCFGFGDYNSFVVDNVNGDNGCLGVFLEDILKNNASVNRFNNEKLLKLSTLYDLTKMDFYKNENSNFGSLSGSGNNSLSSNIINNNNLGQIYSETILNFLSDDNLVANAYLASEVGDNIAKKIGIQYFNKSPYVYLTEGVKYKFLAWCNDFMNFNVRKNANLRGTNGLQNFQVLVNYYEKLFKKESTITETETPEETLPSQGEETQEIILTEINANSLDLCCSKSKILDNNVLVENDVFLKDEYQYPSVNVVSADSLNYTCIPSDIQNKYYFANPNMLEKPITQIFSIRNDSLTDDEKNELSSKVYGGRMRGYNVDSGTSVTKTTYFIPFTYNLYLLSGPAQWL